MFGHAYDIGRNKVLKVTKDESEAINSKKIIGKNLNHIANIYSIKTLNLDKKYYIIILEKLKEAQSELEKLYKDLKYYFDNYNSEHFDESIIDDIKNKEAAEFLKDTLKYGKGVWDKWRERMRESEGEIDFNDLYDLSTWIKDSPTNNNDITDEPPYTKDEILDSIT
jgi:inactivated superfamily I helicase